MIASDNTYFDCRVIHEHVLLTKEGNSNSTNFLLIKFKPLLMSYLKFYRGEYSKESSSVKKFMKYFDKNINFSILNSKSINNKEYVRRTTAYKYFKDNLQRLSEEDFKQELLYAFLLMIKRYNHKKPLFVYYLFTYFHYTLLERLKLEFKNTSINKNVLNNMSQHDIYNKEMEEVLIWERTDENLNFNINKTSNTESLDSYDNEIFLSSSWILGFYNASKFNNLNYSEKNILIDYYIHKFTDQDLANKYGVCRATINRFRLKTKSKLRN